MAKNTFVAEVTFNTNNTKIYFNLRRCSVNFFSLIFAFLPYCLSKTGHFEFKMTLQYCNELLLEMANF